MRIVIEWEDGRTTVITEVRSGRETVNPYLFKIEGRVSQRWINAQAVKSIELFPDEEEA